MNRIEDETFRGETVVLDYTHYVDCQFEECEMVYHGHGALGLVDCEFLDCHWKLSDAAANTLGFMTTLYHHGGGARELIEQTFKNIRKGDIS